MTGDTTKEKTVLVKPMLAATPGAHSPTPQRFADQLRAHRVVRKWQRHRPRFDDWSLHHDREGWFENHAVTLDADRAQTKLTCRQLEKNNFSPMFAKMVLCFQWVTAARFVQKRRIPAANLTATNL